MVRVNSGPFAFHLFFQCFLLSLEYNTVSFLGQLSSHGLTPAYLPAFYPVFPLPFPHSSYTSFFLYFNTQSLAPLGPLHWYFLLLNHCFFGSWPRWLLLLIRAGISSSGDFPDHHPFPFMPTCYYIMLSCFHCSYDLKLFLFACLVSTSSTSVQGPYQQGPGLLSTIEFPHAAQLVTQKARLPPSV